MAYFDAHHALLSQSKLRSDLILQRFAPTISSDILLSIRIN
jgi:hypothetical protein